MTADLSWDDIKATIVEQHIDWRSLFDPRQLSEIDFDCLYAKEFNHGTDGHNARNIIAKLVQVLDTVARHVEFLDE